MGPDGRESRAGANIDLRLSWWRVARCAVPRPRRPAACPSFRTPADLYLNRRVCTTWCARARRGRLSLLAARGVATPPPGPRPHAPHVGPNGAQGCRGRGHGGWPALPGAPQVRPRCAPAAPRGLAQVPGPAGTSAGHPPASLRVRVLAAENGTQNHSAVARKQTALDSKWHVIGCARPRPGHDEDAHPCPQC